MEVEVNLRLPKTTSPSATTEEAASLPRCIVSLKAKPTLANGISWVEEDEEEIELELAKECVDTPSKLTALGSRVLKRVKEEYGFTDFLGFICLGGFENVRDVYECRGVKLEVDQTTDQVRCWELL